MCGFIFIHVDGFALDTCRPVIGKMLATSHRGPDGEGVIVPGQALFGQPSSDH